MLNNIKISRYYETNSIIHKFNPLSKIIFILLFIVSSFISKYYNIVLLILLVIIILISKIPIKNYLKLIKSLRVIIICSIIVNIICGISLIDTFFIILKLIIILLISALLTFTTKPMDISYGLEMLLLPLKIFGIKTNSLAFQISLAFRFIPNIIDEANKILKSQSTRGVDYNNSKLKEKMLIIKSLIIPTFNLSFKRADDLSDIMEVRLYEIDSNRTHLNEKKWIIKDTRLIIFGFIILIFAVMEVL